MTATTSDRQPPARGIYPTVHLDVDWYEVGQSLAQLNNAAQYALLAGLARGLNEIPEGRGLMQIKYIADSHRKSDPVDAEPVAWLLCEMHDRISEVQP